MRTLVILLLVASVATAAELSAAEQRRELEQQQQQQSSGTGYYGACFNVKEYDDDNADDDGNSYFYNGAYRAAYSRYAAFFFCDKQNRDRSKDGPMLDDNTCDGPYVTDLGDYMQVVAPYTTNYCSSCKSCRRRRRRLEDEAAEEEDGNNDYYVAANCNTCKNQCANFWSNANNYAYAEEDFACQASYQDGDIEFYSAPQCITGEITLGSFYDEDCKFKTNQGVVSDESSAISAVFAAAETMTFDCTNNAGVCEALGDISFKCGNDNGGNAICKAAKQALRTRTFYKKPWYSKFPFGLVLLILILSGTLTFLSYTYYVRHTQPRKKEPLMEDQHEEGGVTSPSSGSGGLPPKSPQSHPGTADLPPFT